MGLSRREVLVTTTAAAGVLVGVSKARAQTPPSAFGAPLVEVHVPAGVLTADQKAAMIRGITDVMRRALKQPPDATAIMFVQILETAEGGFGVNGRVFVPRGKS